MNQFVIYHNPRCSKSRETLEILYHQHINPVIVEYLKTPLNLEQIKLLRAHFNLHNFVRHSESIFKALNLTLDNEEEVLHTMLKEPILMQRPIVTFENKAVIARPPEKVLAFIKEAL